MAVMLLFQSHADRFLTYTHELLFDRPEGTSLKQAARELLTHEELVHGVESRLQKHPKIMQHLAEETRLVHTKLKHRVTPSDSDNIKVIKDRGVRRPQVFPGSDAMSWSILLRSP